MENEENSTLANEGPFKMKIMNRAPIFIAILTGFSVLSLSSSHVQAWDHNNVVTNFNKTPPAASKRPQRRQKPKGQRTDHPGERDRYYRTRPRGESLDYLVTFPHPYLRTGTNW